MPHVAIIGAGFTGLAAAYRLRRAGWQVTVYEARDRAGGLAGGFRDDRWDWSLEYFYHHWFASDRHILGWLKELGLRHRVRFPRPLTVVYHRDRFYPFDSPLALLRFPGLTWPDKIRLGLVTAYLRLTPRWQSLEGKTAHEWLQRALGTRAYRALWEPLLEGKFGPYYRQVNMAWFWARIHARTPRLGTYEGGFQALADQLVDRLRAQGVTFRFRTRVEQVSPHEGRGWTVRTTTDEARYDRVLVTLGPPQVARLVPALPEDARRKWAQDLPYLGAVTLVLALDRVFNPQGFYWYNIPKREGFPFLILVEHTHFVPPRHFGGDHILYVGDYVPPDHPYLTMEPQALLEHFLPGLRRVRPDFDLAWVRRFWCFRTAYAQPVPLLHHSRRLPPTRLLPGLYWASMSHVYPWDRGTNYAVELGFRVAGEMMNDAIISS